MPRSRKEHIAARCASQRQCCAGPSARSHGLDREQVTSTERESPERMMSTGYTGTAMKTKTKMRKKKTQGKPDPAIVADIVERIVRAASPEKIVLFGSAARGEMGPDSDLD